MHAEQPMRHDDSADTPTLSPRGKQQEPDIEERQLTAITQQ